MSLRYAHLKTVFLKISMPAVRPFLLWRSNLFRLVTFAGWQRRPKTCYAEHRDRTNHRIRLYLPHHSDTDLPTEPSGQTVPRKTLRRNCT